MELEEAMQKIKEDQMVRIVDCRSKQEVLETGYIKGSYGVYSNTSIAQMLGQLLNAEHKFIIISDVQKQEELVIRFNRIGYNNIIGFVDQQ